MEPSRVRAMPRFSFAPLSQPVIPVAPQQSHSTLQSNDVEMTDVEGSSEGAVMMSVVESDVEMEDVSNQPAVLNNNKTPSAVCRLCAMLAMSRNTTLGTHPPIKRDTRFDNAGRPFC
ncbi:hypothetical protein HPB50_012204 [Hyalomma asiaticum]|uniref:Uncharacterized protein n=1 Tax=Hyalomma asiaticum TaxID=266040 RepID=A0ACB7SPN5_HYAAI|nr:hypothetical protein HPB50_012204 [Hyalomma asiaticum]